MHPSRLILVATLALVSATPGARADEPGCRVPDGADWGTVDATWGTDLTVRLVVAGGS